MSDRRVALVTGTSGEIGGHLARHLIDRGWLVLGVDKHLRSGDPIPDLVFAQCDLADGAAATSAIDGLVARHGVMEVVVNGAARIANAPLITLGPAGWAVHDFSLWHDVVASGLYTAFHTTALGVKHMLDARKKGVIVNISSVCAQGNPGQAAYSAAKAGLDGLTRALAKELGPMGIRVVGLAPGYFDTRSTREHTPAAKLAKVTGAVPLKRLGRLAEISNALDFILTNDYLSGTIVELHGGLVL